MNKIFIVVFEFFFFLMLHFSHQIPNCSCPKCEFIIVLSSITVDVLVPGMPVDTAGVWFSYTECCFLKQVAKNNLTVVPLSKCMDTQSLWKEKKQSWTKRFQTCILFLVLIFFIMLKLTLEISEYIMGITTIPMVKENTRHQTISSCKYGNK